MIDFEKERRKLEANINSAMKSPYKGYVDPNIRKNPKNNPKVKEAFKKYNNQKTDMYKGTFKGKNQGTFSALDKKTQKTQKNQNTTFNRLKDDINKGFDDFNASLAKTVDFFLPDEITLKPAQNVLDMYKNIAKEGEKKFEKTHKTTASKIGGNLVSGLVGALPNLVLGAMTGGVSAGAEAGAALAAEGGMAKSAAQILQNAVTTNSKNPMFWNSFTQIAGPTYEKEKQRGASEGQAIASAMLNAVVGSTIEIGGGIETLKPINYKDMPMKEVLKSLGKGALKTAKEEGLEEIQQYSAEGLASLASGSVNPKDVSNWISFKKDKDAVINPLAQLEQGAYGAAIGGIMGGTHGMVNAGVQMDLAQPNVKKEVKNKRSTKINNTVVEQLQQLEEQKKVKKIEQANKQYEIKKKYSDAVNNLKVVQANEYVVNDEKLSVRKAAEGNDYEIRIENKTFPATYTQAKDFLNAYSQVQIKEDADRTNLEIANREEVINQLRQQEPKQVEHVWTDMERDIVDRIAKRSGIEVVVGDLDINGQIEGNVVTISKYAENPVYQVLKHELTHHIEQSEHFNEFKEFVLTSMAERNHDVVSEIKDTIETYKLQGNNLTWEQAENEYVAQFSEEYLFNSEESIERLARENPNIFKRIYEWIKDTISMLGSSAEAKMLIKAQRMYEKALRTTNGYGTEVKMSLCEFEDGRRFVLIDQDQELFEGVDESEYPKIARELLRKKFLGKVVGTEHRMFVNGRGIREYVHPVKHLSKEIKNVKMKSAGELDNLIDAGFNYRTEADGRDGHIHEDSKGNWEYFDVLFKINGRFFKGTINIQNIKNGKLFKDITKIEDVTEDPSNSVGKNPKFGFLRTSSVNDNITQAETKSKRNNKKYSLEKEKNLYAVHNLNSEDNKLGGFPMPSIAVVKDKIGHSKFGDISLVFDKSTIDPEVKDKESISKTLSDDIDRVINGTFPANKGEVLIGTTSDFLTNVIGAESLEVTMPPKKVYSAIMKVEDVPADRFDEKLNYHGLGKEKFEAAIRASENPIAAYVSSDEYETGKKRGDTIALVTDLVDDNGDFIVVYMKLDVGSIVNKKRIKVNKVITTFGRNTIFKQIQNAIIRDKMLYVDKKRSQFLTRSEWGLSPNSLLNIDFDTNINNFWANVKYLHRKNLIKTEKTKNTTIADAFAKAVQKKAEADRKRKEQRFSVGNHIKYDAKLKSTSERLYKEASNKYRALFKTDEVETEKEKTIPGMKKAERYENRQLKKFSDEMLNILDASKYEDSQTIKKDRQELMDKIKAGTLTEEDKKKYFDNMYYNALQEDAGYIDTYNKIRKNLKTAKLKVTDEILSNITDYKYRKREFRHINFAKPGEGGLYIDDFYAGQQERFPGALPNVNTQEEMLEVLAEKANTYEDKYKKVESAMGSDEFYNYSWERFNEQVENLKAEADIIERFRQSKEKREAFNLTNEDVKLYVEKINELKKKVRKIVDRVILTEEDNTILCELLERKVNEDYVRSHSENAENIIKAYEVKKELREAQSIIRENGERTKKEITDDIRKLTENAKLWKDKKAGWRYARETSERNFEDIAGNDAEGIINYIYKPTHVHEAESNRFKNQIRQRINDENISSKRIYTVKRSIDLKNPYGYIKAPGIQEQLKKTKGKLSEADLIQLKGENLIDDDFIRDCGANPESINKKVEVFRDIYNLTFEAANNVLMDFGYDPIEYRQDYFPHFSEDRSDSLIAKMLQKVGMDYNKNDLPTDIAGLTETFKPGKKFFANALQRQGSSTEYNALKGLDIYLEGVSDVIYHTEDIQKRRILEKELRIKFGKKGLKREIDEINRQWKNGIIDTAKKDVLINDAMEKGTSSQGALVTWIRDDTDTLAGKKSYIDRPPEKLMSRGMYDLSRQLEGRVAANMVGVNPASWLTNFIPLIQGGNVKYLNVIKGMAATLYNNIKHDDIYDESKFLINRRGSDKLYQSTKDMWINCLTSPMEIIDQFTSEALVRAKYYEEISNGATHVEALDIADRFAADTIADRSKGAVPTLFNAKNPVAKCLTMFQIEVNNQWSHLVKDIPRNSNTVAAMSMAFARLVIGSYIYNDVYEKLIGRRPALDIFSWLNDLYGDLAGKKNKNFVDIVMDALDKDEEDEKDKASRFIESVEKKSGGKTSEDFIKNVAQDIPFFGGLIGGGRIPISSALPNVSRVIKGLADVGTEDKTWENVKDTIGKEMAKPALYFLPPVGGGQIKKFVESGSALINQGTYGAGKDGKKKLEFAVDRTAGNAIKGMLFGKYAMDGAKEYVESGFKKMSEKKTSAYLELLEKEMKPSKAAEALKKVDTSSETALRESIGNLKMSDYEKTLIEHAFNPGSKVDYSKPETVDYANLYKDQKEVVDKIKNKTGLDLADSIDIYNIRKNTGTQSGIVNTFALLEAGYHEDILKKLGYSDTYKGAINTSKNLINAGVSYDKYKPMFDVADTDGNGKVNQAEAIAYLKKRNDLTREQKYYIMIALCGGVADRNNPWY